jgi:hypothetical protein
MPSNCLLSLKWLFYISQLRCFHFGVITFFYKDIAATPHLFANKINTVIPCLQQK